MYIKRKFINSLSRYVLINAFLPITVKCESFNSSSEAKYTGNNLQNVRVKEELRLYVYKKNLKAKFYFRNVEIAADLDKYCY
jgi:hypothetical protein